jgi:transposase InsO family protein
MRIQVGQQVPPLRRARPVRSILGTAPVADNDPTRARQPNRAAAQDQEVVSTQDRAGTGCRGHRRTGADRRPSLGPARTEPASLPGPERRTESGATPHHRPPTGSYGACRHQEVGRIPDGGGWRVHGRGSAQDLAARAAAKRRRPGYSFLHTAVDGYSRLAYTEALDDEKAVTAIGFVFRARAFFAAHGITRIERIVTDNGACYKAKDFAKALPGARHQRITPYTPRHNGKVERYNRILAEEFLYAREWTSDLQRQQALEIWNIHYNYRLIVEPAPGRGSSYPSIRCQEVDVG